MSRRLFFPFVDSSGSPTSPGSSTVDSVFGRTGAVSAQSNDYTWAQINKTTSDIADITTKSHTSLSDIGTNTHAQIDTAITNSTNHIANTSNPHSVTVAQLGAVATTGDESISGVKTFNSIPQVSGAASSSNDVVNYATLSTFLGGVTSLQPAVRAASTAAGTLASDFENGDTLDGVTLATNDRILIKDQADASENGIYIVQASGAPSRATDFNETAEADQGALVTVLNGTANENTLWVQVTDDPVIDTSDLVFNQLPAQNTTTAAADTHVLYSDGGVIAGESTMTYNKTTNTLSVENIEVEKVAIFDEEIDNGNSGTAETIDWDEGNKQMSTLTDNCTFTFDAPASPTNLVLKLVQDGTGSRTVTWPASVMWPDGTAPTLTTDADAIDIISFYWDGTNFFGASGLNYSVPA